mmetsp:Transcript_18550/g.30543  ORF Transcript_18550/g.30543 Transcript_18550/m.30543 type:complete len:666 (+) Transcript_18550:654-2651(+)
MRISTLETAEFQTAFGIAMSALETVKDAEVSRPGVSWGRVAPGERSAQHRHDELEMFVMLEGTADIHSDDETRSVQAGDVIEFDPFERHVIENTGANMLTFLDIYWRDPKAMTITSPVAGHATGQAPVFVFSTPPTPNGDLHLGHLSGPYLGADIFTRFQRMQGRAAYHLTGSDDYQSYVQTRADTEGCSAQEVAARYSEEILETLRLLDCAPDQYTQTDQCADYAARITTLFDRVVDHPSVGLRRSKALSDAAGYYRYEPDVSGICPDCGHGAGGNICEECGAPNLCHDLINPRLAQGAPHITEETRIEIDLHSFADHIRNHLEAAHAPPRIRDLAERVLARADAHFPITHPSTWGLPVTDLADQVIWVWPEMAFGFLIGIEELGRRIGQDWNSQAPSDDWEIVHFFGFDNSFYHAILYPSLYAAALPNWQGKITYAVNEFYLLEHKKFSTSRRHAIWGKDILTDETVDPLRLFLSQTRPEAARTNFSRLAYESFRIEVYEGQLMAWLRGIFDALQQDWDNILPDAGDWTPAHIAFKNRINAARVSFETAMVAQDFSARRAARTFLQLLADCQDFSASQSRQGQMRDARGRTVTALEFCAAGLLCSMAGALMPRFAARLGTALQIDEPIEWHASVGLLPAGARLDGAALFPSVPVSVPTDTAAE